VGSYTIGKERVFLRVAEHFGWKVCVSAAKYKIIKCCDFPDFEQRFTMDPTETPLHVIPINNLAKPKLLKYLEDHPQYTSVVGVRPTGWTFEENPTATEVPVAPKLDGKVMSISAPYSEHSSFDELRAFVVSTRPVMIISTVPASKEVKEEMNGYFADWMGFTTAQSF